MTEVATSDQITELTPTSNTFDLEALKTLLHHLLRRVPVSESEQIELQRMVDELHVPAGEKVPPAVAAPPGFEEVPGSPGMFRPIPK